MKIRNLEGTRQCGSTCGTACASAMVRPGTEAIASLLSGLTEAIREGCTRHFDDFTGDGDPEDNEETVVEADVSSTYLHIPSPPQSTDQKPTRRPTLRYQRQPVLTWKPGPAIVEFGFESHQFSEIPRGRTAGPRIDGGTAWENAKTSRDE